MKISFDLTLDDYMAMQKHHLGTSEQYRKTRIKAIYLFPVLLAIVLLMESIRTELNYIMLVSFLIMAVLWVVIFPKRFDAMTLKNIKKIAEKPESATLFGHFEIEFSDEAIVSVNPFGESKFNWEKIYKVDETDKYFFIYIHAMAALTIPKFKLPSDTDIAAVRGILQAKIPEPVA